MRKKLTRAFLWSSVTLWGVALGAKIFDLLVLARAWGGDVPASLIFYPYGKNWPVDPGDFFQPLSAFLLLAIVGALWSGWKTTRSYRLYLELSVGAFALIWLATPTFFWPLINAIYQVAHHRVSIARRQGDCLGEAMVHLRFDSNCRDCNRLLLRSACHQYSLRRIE